MDIYHGVADAVLVNDGDRAGRRLKVYVDSLRSLNMSTCYSGHFAFCFYYTFLPDKNIQKLLLYNPRLNTYSIEWLPISLNILKVP